MAKSSRSKWKKLHKRQRAQQLAETVSLRVSRLHQKLNFAANGGLSAVPMEEPEKRFHFLNPEINPKLPHSGKELNNNYEQIVKENVDFSKPLRMAAPKTNFFGKSDLAAPHRMTKEFEIISADAPIAGHAFTAEDLARKEEKEINKINNFNLNENEEEDNDNDGPAEFVLGCNDAADETNVNIHKLIAGVQPKQKSLKIISSSSSFGGGGENVLENVPHKIKSMESTAKRNNRVVVVAGDKKAKKLTNISSTRLVKSGSKKTLKKKSTKVHSM